MEKAKGELVPGGLAMVYGLKVDLQTNGMIVETVELADKGHSAKDGITYSGDIAWYCEREWLRSRKNSGIYVESGYAYIGAEHLMPINPEADPLETTQEQEKCTHA